MSRAELRFSAFAFMLASWALLASSGIAWEFDHARELGPSLGWLYPPFAAVRWWNAWGSEPGYTMGFVRGAMTPLAVGALPLLGVALYEKAGRLRLDERDPDEGLGSARELLREGFAATEPGGVALGAHGRKILFDKIDGHRLLLGAARSGKGTRHIVPTLLTYPGSVIAYDPKLELFDLTAGWREKLGPVFVLDPTRLGDPLAHFNPLDEIRPEHLIEDCQGAAHMLAVPSSGAGSAGDSKIWNNAAADLLTAVLLHVMCSDDKSLAHVAQLVRKIKAGEYPEEYPDPLVEEMFAGHAAMDSRVRDSVTFTLATDLGFLLSRTIRRMTAKSDFAASDLMAHDKPVTVYISVPPADADRVRPLTRLLLQSLLYPNMREIENAQDGRKKRHDLLLVIDEMPQLGRLDVLEKGLAVCAGYGIKALLVAQSLDQISTTYGGAFQSITGNMQAILAIPGFSGHGSDALIRWAGEHHILQRARSRQPGLKSLLPTSSENEARAPTLNQRDLLIRGRRETLVFIQGALPTWIKAAPYYKHPLYRGRYGISPSKTLYALGQGRRSEKSPMPMVSAANESSPRQLLQPEES